AAFAPDLGSTSDQKLTLNAPIAVPLNATSASLEFWQRYDFEVAGNVAYDGGVLEISTNGGSTWSSPTFSWGGYTGTLADCPTQTPTGTSTCEPVWRIVPDANPTGTQNYLNDVTVVSANDIWAAGTSWNGRSFMLIEHWNGQSWSVVPTPDLGVSWQYLEGIY